jgi:predicted outer membrane lipoprotein
MNWPIYKIVFAFFGALLATAGGVTVALWSDHLTRKREQDTGVSSNLRHFRNDISEIIALLQKTSDDEVRKFNTDTRDQVLVFCARVAEDIPGASADEFDCACRVYCGIQERDKESGIKFMLYRIESGKHHQGGAAIPNPYRDDQRSLKERMLSALEELKNCAK